MTDNGQRLSTEFSETRIKSKKEKVNEDHKKNKAKQNFALRAPVEETKDLIAVHNATEDNIKGLLDLKGFPMPSIAIIKAAQGHNDYGPYSFVFDKSTIDPQANTDNKVYGGDAWTPTAPQIEYGVKEDKAYNEFFSKIHSLMRGIPTNQALNRLGLYYTPFSPHSGTMRGVIQELTLRLLTALKNTNLIRGSVKRKKQELVLICLLNRGVRICRSSP